NHIYIIAILAQIYTCNRYSVIKRKFDRLTNQYNTIFKENEENKKYVGFLDKAVSEAKYFRAKYNECSSELTMSQIESKNLLEKLREANTQLQYERNKEQIEKDKIKAKLLEKKKKREIEKLALQELIDEGEIFPEANKRPPIPKDVVDTVWNRDGGKCVYCGSNENLHLDHIIPFSKGGDTSVENLQLLCQKCNLEKSNKIG
ncbi:HNH endonuclease, partial [Bacteroides thetaiotaomicron]